MGKTSKWGDYMLIKTQMNHAINDFLHKNLPITLNIIGVIENVPKAEIYVDDDTNPKGIFIKKDYMHCLHTDSDDFIEEVCDTFFKDGFYGFSAVKASIAKKVKDKYQIHWDNPCTLYYMPEGNLDTSLIKNEVQVIDIKDAETINKYYEYGGPDNVDAIKDDIINRPSSGIYVDGQLVSWVLVHDDNSMGIMYTLEHFRKKGYAVDVSIDLASKIIKQGKTPFIHIVKGNDKSVNLAKKIGFVQCGDVDWFGIVAGTPKEVIEANGKSEEIFYENIVPKEYHRYFRVDKDYDRVHLFLQNLKKDFLASNNTERFKLEEVKQSHMIENWCKIICQGYGIMGNEEIDNLFKSVIKNKKELRLYLGLDNNVPIAALAMHVLDEWVKGIQLLTVVPKERGKGLGGIFLHEILKKLQEEKSELLVAKTPKKLAQIFHEIGFSKSQ